MMRCASPLHLALLAAIAAFPALAPAQSNQFKLDPEGKWVRTAAPEPGSDEALIADARKALAEDRPDDARTLLDTWITAHESESNPYLPEALQLRGDAITAAGDEYQALYDYERVIMQFPGTDSYTTAVERELDIAVRYVNGMRRKLLGMRVIGAEDIGEELLVRVQERMQGSRLAERAGIELADYYYRTHNLAAAADMYDIFIDNFPNSQYHMKAMQRRVYATIARFKGPAYDGAPLLDAQVLVRRFAAFYPQQASKAGLDDALVARLDESAGDQMLESARWYLRRGDAVSARYMMKRLIREHPRTAAASLALDTMVQHGWMKAPAPEPKPEPGANAPSSAPPPLIASPEPPTETVK